MTHNQKELLVSHTPPPHVASEEAGLLTPYEPLERARAPQWRRKTCSLAIACSALLLCVATVAGAVILILELIKRFSQKPAPIILNIHYKLSAHCEQQAMKINEQVTSLDPTQHIDFQSTSQPHVTLYMTSFSPGNVEKLKLAMNRTVESWRFAKLPSGIPVLDCLSSALPSVDVSGAYGMWVIERSSCLQFLSDSIVNHTFEFVDRDAFRAIPSWINSLPEPTRSNKIRNIQRFGSPNVFEEFDPHVTLAHDDSNMDALARAFSQVTITGCNSTIAQVAIGMTGMFGTVQRGRDVSVFRVQ